MTTDRESGCLLCLCYVRIVKGIPTREVSRSGVADRETPKITIVPNYDPA